MNLISIILLLITILLVYIYYLKSSELTNLKNKLHYSEFFEGKSESFEKVLHFFSSLNEFESSNSRKIREPNLCQITRPMAEAYFNSINSTGSIPNPNEVYGVKIKNSELLGLAQTAKTNFSVIMFGLESSGEKTVILFPLINNTELRDKNYANQTHETFPDKIKGYTNVSQIATLFNC